MARKKPMPLTSVKSLDEANATLAQIGELKRKIDAINTVLNEQIDALKAEAEIAAAPLLAQIKGLEAGITAFSEYNKDELFAEKRSRELTFGTIGYRRSSEIAAMPKGSMAQILSKLHELEFLKGIRVSESVNKEEMRGWTDEKLALVGARRVEKDVFWYELNETALQQTAA